MDRMTSVEFNGRTVYFNYSVAVMFEMTDEFKNIKNALDRLNAPGANGFDTVKWFATHMSQDAELCRRAEGYDPGEALKAKELNARTIRPVEYAELRNAIVNAITLGYNREIPENEGEERDLGLEELQAKKPMAGG